MTFSTEITHADAFLRPYLRPLKLYISIANDCKNIFRSSKALK